MRARKTITTCSLVGTLAAWAAADLPASAGGWYRLDVRSREGDRGTAAARGPRLGIGEVFVTAGRSNSSNWGDLTGKQSRWDGIHFGTTVLETLANRWFEVLDTRSGSPAPGKD